MQGTLKSLGIACAFLALSACATRPPQSKFADWKFDGAKHGVVVFGLAASNPLPPSSPFDNFESWEVRFDTWPPTTLDEMIAKMPEGKFRAENAAFVLKKGWTGIGVTRGGPFDQSEEDPPRVAELRYFAKFITDDKTYYLKHVSVAHKKTWVKRGSIYTTTFASATDSQLTDETLESKLKSGRIPNFQLKRGEIIYVGNFYFDVPYHEEKMPRFIRYEIDETAARAYLAKNPTIKGEMTTRPILGTFKGEGTNRTEDVQ
jgi:hypothetical protein